MNRRGAFWVIVFFAAATLFAGCHGDLHAGGGITAQKAPTHGLLEGGVENGVGIANCPRREFFLVHPVIGRLQIKRGKIGELAFAQCRADGTAEQRFVVREGLCAELWPGSELEPAVEVLVEGQVRPVEFPALLALGNLRIQILLCRAEGAADGAVEVAAPAGLRVETQVNPHQPPVVTAGDDLTLPSRQASSFHSRNLAHNWHTGFADLPVFCGFKWVSTDR